jgi:hypothetical protein
MATANDTIPCATESGSRLDPNMLAIRTWIRDVDGADQMTRFGLLLGMRTGELRKPCPSILNIVRLLLADM